MRDTIKLLDAFFEGHLATKNRSLRFKIFVCLLLTAVTLFLSIELTRKFFY